MFEHAYVARPAGRGVAASRPVAPPASAPARRARPASALLFAGACVAAMAVVWAVASFLPAFHRADARVLYDFTQLSRPRIDWVANHAIRLLEPTLFILWGVALVAFAVARNRPRTALAIVAVMLLSPLTSELLKPVLAQPHDSVGGVHIGAASWPSGHSTAAMALVLSAVLAAPPRLRGIVGTLGGAYLALVTVSLLILAWHMPSDILGGFLVAGMWTALMVAFLRATEPRRPAAS